MRKRIGLIVPILLVVLYFGVRKYDFYVGATETAVTEVTTESTPSVREMVATLTADAGQSLSDNQLAAVTTLIDSATATETADIGISFVDLTSGQVISSNGDVDFVAASTSKVALVMMVADLLAAGELAETDSIAYTEADYEEGTGIIQTELAASYTIAELFQDAIIYSDNIATNMLLRSLGGLAVVRQYYQENYVSSLTDFENNYLTPNQATEILRLLYDGQNVNTYYEEIIANMTETAFDTRLYTTLTADAVAHKVGSLDTNVHDIGLFFTESPYAVAVYTKNSEDGESFISQFSDELFEIITAST